MDEINYLAHNIYLSNIWRELIKPSYWGISLTGLKVIHLWGWAWPRNIWGWGQADGAILGTECSQYPRWVVTLSTPRSCGEMTHVMWYLLTWEESAAFSECLVHCITTALPCEPPMHCNFEEGCPAQDYASPPLTWSLFAIIIHFKQWAGQWRVHIKDHKRKLDYEEHKICPTCGTIKEFWLRHIVYSQQLSGK